MELYIPILIFFARILDVSIGTVRIIVVIRGRKFLAALMGFFEVLIWVLAVAAVIENISDSWITVIAYGGGFATGTLVGMWIEEKLAMGYQLIRIVNIDPSRNVAAFMRERNWIVTDLDARGVSGRAELCFLVIPRKKAPKAFEVILDYCPKAFLTVEDIRSSVGGSNLFHEPASKLPWWNRIIKIK